MPGAGDIDDAWAWREKAARALSRMLPPDVLCYVDINAHAYALTFDDGPHPDTTPGLLDVLARHSARATFFLIGERVRAHEAIVARIAAERHELANHLMRDERSVSVPAERFRRELAEVTSLLRAHGPVRWVRPGSGWFTPRMRRAATEQNLRLVLGTVVAAHTGTEADEQIARRLAGAVRPGSIAVLHEGTHRRRGVVTAADELLTRLAGQGFAAMTVSELVALRRPGP